MVNQLWERKIKEFKVKRRKKKENGNLLKHSPAANKIEIKIKYLIQKEGGI